MDISFKKDLKTSTLILSGLPPAADGDFTMNMLRVNSVPSLLRTRSTCIDGEICYVYDISSRHSFAKLYESTKLSSDVLYAFIGSLRRLAASLDDYLLDPNNIVLLPQCLFLNSSRSEFYFCCCPAYVQSLSVQLDNLCACFLSLLDYEDQAAVSVAFELSRAVQSENFTVRELSKIPRDLQTESRTASGLQAQPSLQPQPPEETVKNKKSPLQKELSFREKAKLYFKDKSFSEVYDDINSVKIFKKIKQIEPPLMLCADDILPAETQDAPVIVPAAVYDEPQPEAAAPEDGGSALENTARLGVFSENTRFLSGIGAAQGITAAADHFPFTIGKQEDADLVLRFPQVSRIHGRICKDDDGCYFFEDMNSTNGTLLNGTPLNAYTPARLSPGDVLSIAGCEFLFN